MTTPQHGLARNLTIAARVLAIGGILFVSLFALDVFEAGVPPLQILVGLVMHLIPSFVLVAVLAVAWRFPVAGGLAFIGLGLLPFVFLPNPVWVNATLGGPFALAGALFLAGVWIGRRK